MNPKGNKDLEVSPPTGGKNDKFNRNSSFSERKQQIKAMNTSFNSKAARETDSRLTDQQPKNKQIDSSFKIAIKEEELPLK